jgi:tetratricopeptide (TPR) repeat protein
MATNETDGAVEAFRHALRLRPSSSEAQEQFALASARQKEQQPAQTALAPSAGATPQPPISMQPVWRDSSSPDDPNQIEILEGYIRREQYTEVEYLAQHYVRTHPDSSWGYYILGYAQFAQKKLNDSIRSLAKSLQLDIDNADAHKILGKILMIIGRFDAALIEMEQARQLMPQSAEVRYNLGKIYSASDDYPRARAELEEAVRLDPDYMEAHDALGFACEALGEEVLATQYYQKAIELNEKQGASFVAPYTNLSAYYNQGGESDKALEYAERALRIDPKSDTAYFQMGRAYARQEKWQEAADAVEKAIARNPVPSSYYYVLSGAYRALGRSEESRKTMEKFQELEEKTAEFERARRESRTSGSEPPGSGASRD